MTIKWNIELTAFLCFFMSEYMISSKFTFFLPIKYCIIVHLLAFSGTRELPHCHGGL